MARQWLEGSWPVGVQTSKKKSAKAACSSFLFQQHWLLSSWPKGTSCVTHSFTPKLQALLHSETFCNSNSTIGTLLGPPMSTARYIGTKSDTACSWWKMRLARRSHTQDSMHYLSPKVGLAGKQAKPAPANSPRLKKGRGQWWCLKRRVTFKNRGAVVQLRVVTARDRKA